MQTKNLQTVLMRVFQKNSITLLIHCFSISNSLCQWTTLPIPGLGRFDDIYFFSDSVGWAVGGNAGAIYQTVDGGSSWIRRHSSGNYLRSIEFATPTLGFCGSLNSTFYKTTDGGITWTDIANTISPVPQGICGISAPSAEVVYGCGIWSSPAYVIKSIDGGDTWTTIDLSGLASALVDVHFINIDTGFVSGMANPMSEGGVILFTANGGKSWSIKYKTMTAEDYIWKLQTPDGLHYFGSIQSLPSTNNVRIVQSDDAGDTWTTKIIRSTYSYVQTIGFINTLKGWTGGGSDLYETTDGGNTWEIIPLGLSYNRFFKLNDHTAFLSGRQIYKYTAENTSSHVDITLFDDIHSLNVYPNPASQFAHIELSIHNTTYCKLALYSSDGRLIQSIYIGHIEKGTKHYTIGIENIPVQTLYLVLKSNEGLIYRKLIKI